MAMQIFRNMAFNNLIKSGKGFRVVNCDDIVTNYEIKGSVTTIKYSDKNWLFDDIGDEIKQAVHFGTIRNVMKEIITKRNRAFVENGNLTFITSNYNMELIEKAYEMRVEDRFHEMFNEIILTGKSLRK